MSENQIRIHQLHQLYLLVVSRNSQALQDVLQMDCPFRFLTIHSDGEGGIGKTQLLLQMQAYCESHPEITLLRKSSSIFTRLKAVRTLALCGKLFPI